MHLPDHVRRGPVRRRHELEGGGARVINVAIAIAYAALVAPASCGDEFPPALRRMLRARATIEHADVSWTQANTFDALTQGQPISYRALVAGDETACFVEGTPDGVAAWVEDGQPIPRSRFATLQRPGDRWEFRSDWLRGSLWEGEQERAEGSDVRLVGLLPVPALAGKPSEALKLLFSRVPGSRRYTESVEAQVHIVELKIDGAEHRVVWHIDSEKDWNPVLVESYLGPTKMLECRVEYSQTDGVWFPSSATYVNPLGEIVTQIIVDSARFDPAELPRHLTPETIGFGNGMQVSVESGPRAPAILNYVRGERLLDQAAYYRGRDAGEFESDPRLKELRARLIEEAKAAGEPVPPDARRAAQSQPAEVVPHVSDDAWETYTLTFIRRYQLDVSQSQAALRVLRDCQTRRTAVTRSRHELAAELESRAANAQDADEARRLEARIAEVQAEVDARVEAVFETQLKPRLERIPTREQRAAAEPAATRPAAP